MVTARKTVIVVLCLAFFTGLGALACLETSYWGNLPKTADEASGRVHQVTVSHGSIRYATQQEVETLGVAKQWALIATVCGLTAGILNFKYRDFTPPKRLSIHSP
jgi:hypothetical protein